MTAKAIGVGPWTWFRDVLVRVDQGEDPAKLTPHAWKQHLQAEVPAHRDEVLAQLMGDAR